MYLSDLTFTEDGNPTYMDTKANPTALPIIHFSKMRLLANVFTTVSVYQQKSYDVSKSHAPTRAWIQSNWQVLPEKDLYVHAKEAEANIPSSTSAPTSSAANSTLTLVSPAAAPVPLAITPLSALMGSGASLASKLSANRGVPKTLQEPLSRSSFKNLSDTGGRPRSNTASARPSSLALSFTAPADMDSGAPSEQSLDDVPKSTSVADEKKSVGGWGRKIFG